MSDNAFEELSRKLRDMAKNDHNNPDYNDGLREAADQIDMFAVPIEVVHPGKMTNDEYSEAARHTDVGDYAPISKRLQFRQTLMILHALMGITTEAGEMMDNLKKHLIYGKSLDIVNFKEEDGDLRWYLSLLEFACNYTADDAQEVNIAKLAARFPDKFNEIDALNRNLNEERKILERVSIPETPEKTKD